MITGQYLAETVSRQGQIHHLYKATVLKPLNDLPPASWDSQRENYSVI